MIHKLHRGTAYFLLIFIVSHLAVHLTALGGAQSHLASLSAIQIFYRNPVIEPILILALATQIILGLRLVIVAWRRPDKDSWAKWQLASGIYLGIFIINHVIAAFTVRFYFGLDSNFWWASGPLVNPFLKWLFYPYYWLAIMAIALHIAAALRFYGRPVLATCIMGAGLCLSTVIVATFGGAFYPIETPAAYQEVYQTYLSALGFGKAGNLH